MKNLNEIQLKRSLEEKIIVAARDGNNNQVLLDLVNGKFDLIFQEEKKKLVLEAIKTSSFQDQKEALAILLNKGKSDISEIPSHDMCYSEIQEMLSDLKNNPNNYEALYQDQDHSSILIGVPPMFYIESM